MFVGDTKGLTKVPSIGKRSVRSNNKGVRGHILHILTRDHVCGPQRLRHCFPDTRGKEGDEERLEQVVL